MMLPDGREVKALIYSKHKNQDMSAIVTLYKMQTGGDIQLQLGVFASQQDAPQVYRFPYDETCRLPYWISILRW
jgi:hypothetical protein